MKEELNLEQLEMIIGQIRQIQAQHPKANVTYDTEKQRINITYPLPADFIRIKSMSIHYEK